MQGQRLLVVAFGSAPGLPNFGGLLHRIRHELQDPAHHEWDTLYIVDSRRNWYEGDSFQVFLPVPSLTFQDAAAQATIANSARKAPMQLCEQARIARSDHRREAHAHLLAAVQALANQAIP